VFAVFIIRRATPEPERWQQRADQTRRGLFWQPVIDILTPPYRGRTIGNLLLLTVCVISLWARSTYVPTAMAVITGAATIRGRRVAMPVCDFGFLGV